MKWYVKRAGKIVGPFAVDHLRSMSEALKIKPTDLVAKTKAGPWYKLKDIEQKLFHALRDDANLQIDRSGSVRNPRREKIEQQRKIAERKAAATLEKFQLDDSRWLKKVVTGKIVLDGSRVCFIKRNGKFYGRFEPKEVRELSATSVLLPSDQLAVSGFHSWLEFGTIDMGQLEEGVRSKVATEVQTKIADEAFAEERQRLKDEKRLRTVDFIALVSTASVFVGFFVVMAYIASIAPESKYVDPDVKARIIQEELQKHQKALNDYDRKQFYKQQIENQY